MDIMDDAAYQRLLARKMAMAGQFGGPATVDAGELTAAFSAKDQQRINADQAAGRQLSFGQQRLALRGREVDLEALNADRRLGIEEQGIRDAQRVNQTAAWLGGAQAVLGGVKGAQEGMAYREEKDLLAQEMARREQMDADMKKLYGEITERLFLPMVQPAYRPQGTTAKKRAYARGMVEPLT